MDVPCAILRNSTLALDVPGRLPCKRLTFATRVALHNLKASRISFSLISPGRFFTKSVGAFRRARGWTGVESGWIMVDVESLLEPEA